MMLFSTYVGKYADTHTYTYITYRSVGIATRYRADGPRIETR